MRGQQQGEALCEEGGGQAMRGGQRKCAMRNSSTPAIIGEGDCSSLLTCMHGELQGGPECPKGELFCRPERAGGLAGCTCMPRPPSHAHPLPPLAPHIRSTMGCLFSHACP